MRNAEVDMLDMAGSLHITGGGASAGYRLQGGVARHDKCIRCSVKITDLQGIEPEGNALSYACSHFH